jgi:hypothetical protein
MTQNNARVVIRDFLAAPRSTEYDGNPKNQNDLILAGSGFNQVMFPSGWVLNFQQEISVWSRGSLEGMIYFPKSAENTPHNFFLILAFFPPNIQNRRGIDSTNVYYCSKGKIS